MTRRARRSTHWEGQSFNLVIGDATIVGDELINQAMVDDFGPATLVRMRGTLLISWTTSPTIVQTNVVSSCWVAVRKVSLARTTDVYAAPSGNLDDAAYTSAEDILYFGAVKLDGGLAIERTSDGTAKIFQRPVGQLDFDIKAMRRFDSSEERLVLEMQLQHGQVTSVTATAVIAMRMLFKAG